MNSRARARPSCQRAVPQPTAGDRQLMKVWRSAAAKAPPRTVVNSAGLQGLCSLCTRRRNSCPAATVRPHPEALWASGVVLNRGRQPVVYKASKSWPCTPAGTWHSRCESTSPHYPPAACNDAQHATGQTLRPPCRAFSTHRRERCERHQRQCKKPGGPHEG